MEGSFPRLSQDVNNLPYYNLGKHRACCCKRVRRRIYYGAGFAHAEDVPRRQFRDGGFQQGGWKTDLTPRDPEKLAHVIKTARDRGMKVIVYTTPVWFLKNTPREHEQQIDPTPGPMGTVPHWGRPDNANLFFQQISRVFKEMSLDGFYFDGIFGAPEHLAASYHLTRATRELVGDHGILIYHGTGDTPKHWRQSNVLSFAERLLQLHLARRGRRETGGSGIRSLFPVLIQPEQQRLFIALQNRRNSLGGTD